MRVLLATLLITATVVPLAYGQPRRPTEQARRYCVDPNFWQQPEGAPETCEFPEKTTLGKRSELGLAFSGGGTRSATVTLGALRGLRDNGWLDQFGYMAAVSGGAWAALPYAYSPQPDATILGTHKRCETTGTDKKAEVSCGTPGPIGEAIAKSSLLRCGLEYLFDNKYLPAAVRDLPSALGFKCGSAGTRDGAFAKILGHVFLNEDVCGGCHGDVLGAVKPSYPSRPYLILGGTAVEQNANWESPRLIPVEITQDYVGIRQRHGHLGASYVDAWAYGRRPIAISRTTATYLRDDAPVMTLENALAVTGSAPYLATLLSRRPAMAFASGFFPRFGVPSVGDAGSLAWTAELPHGDGGFSDNLGVLPLLARGVKRLLVFVNANDRAEKNDALASLFHPIDGVSANGDRSNNVVFKADEYQKLLSDLHRAAANGPAVACYAKREVLSNRHYNVRASKEGVSICWVYNDRNVPWLNQQAEGVRKALSQKSATRKDENAGSDVGDRFPWYRTFGENIPYVVDLNGSQVAALSALAYWTVTDSAKKEIGKTLGLHSAP